jgi:hypothetical protein
VLAEALEPERSEIMTVHRGTYPLGPSLQFESHRVEDHGQPSEHDADEPLVRRELR